MGKMGDLFAQLLGSGTNETRISELAHPTVPPPHSSPLETTLLGGEEWTTVTTRTRKASANLRQEAGRGQISPQSIDTTV